MATRHMNNASIREGAFVEAVYDALTHRGSKCHLIGSLKQTQELRDAFVSPQGNQEAKILRALMDQVVHRLSDSEPMLFNGRTTLEVEILPQSLRKGSNIVLRRQEVGWEIGIGVHGGNKDTINHRIWTEKKNLFQRMGVGDFPDTPEYARIEAGTHEVISRLPSGERWRDHLAVKDLMYEVAATSLQDMILYYADIEGETFVRGLFGALVGTGRDYYHIEVVDSEATIRAFNCNNCLGRDLRSKVGVPKIQWPTKIVDVTRKSEGSSLAHNWLWVYFNNETTGKIRIHNPVGDSIDFTLKLGGRLDTKDAGEKVRISP